MMFAALNKQGEQNGLKCSFASSDAMREMVSLCSDVMCEITPVWVASITISFISFRNFSIITLLFLNHYFNFGA